MKMCVFIGLLFLVVASSLSVRAVDNPAQAAARAALEQKLQALETPPANPPTALPPKIVAPPIAPAATSVTVAVPITKPTPPAAIPPAAPPVTPRPKATPPARPLAKTPVAFEKPADNIVTIYGTVYRHAQVEKVETDGLVISYWTANGGFAVTKLDFRMLSPELQKQYQK
ncbi:MAG: hypothetical protein WCK57_13120 [Verrucomicrobiae bacterium]